MFQVLIPFVIIYLYEFYKRKSLSKYCFIDLWIISLWILSFAAFKIPRKTGIGLWIPIGIFLLLRWYCSYRFRTALSWQLLRFLRHPTSFFDSAKDLKLFKPCFIGFGLVGVSLPAFSSSPNIPFWVSGFILSTLVTLKIHLSSKNKVDRDTKSLIFTFPHEISIPFSPNYPALRKTIAFLGEKQIDIPINPYKKPHIIFVFLESFRAKNIGCLGAKIPASPYFDAWAKKGLLFQNFHANGLQTFRAFISAYFGIPGHIPTVSLKPFCSLPMIGLPQILKDQGYHPAVIQSGALSFDHLYPFFSQPWL